MNRTIIVISLVVAVFCASPASAEQQKVTLENESGNEMSFELYRTCGDLFQNKLEKSGLIMPHNSKMLDLKSVSEGCRAYVKFAAKGELMPSQADIDNKIEQMRECRTPDLELTTEKSTATVKIENGIINCQLASD